MFTLEILYELANFDLIPLDFITDFIDEKVGDQDRNKYVYLGSQAESSGFDKTNPINNTMLPIFIITCTLIVVLLAKILSYCHWRTRQFYKDLKEKVFWNHFVRLFLEEYIIICLACLIKLTALDTSTPYEIFSSCYAIGLLIMVVTFPIFVTWFLHKKHSSNSITMRDFMKRWGSLVLDLNVKEKQSLYFSFIFMLRRWIMAITVVIVVK